MIEVSEEGWDELRVALRRLSIALSNPRDLMADIGDALIATTRARFREGVAPDDSAWIPKSVTTLDAYLARGETISFKPLIGPSQRLSREIFYQVTPDGSSVEIGSNILYSAVMQFGAKRGAFGQSLNGSPIPWGDIPARPFLGISSQDELNIGEAIAEWLEDALSQDGFTATRE
jgi:phage virion morphogenesis protein